MRERSDGAMRPLVLTPGYNKYAEGSCLIKMGDTHVICTATVENKVPVWLKGKGQGWITAEYGMLPRATSLRTEREAVRGNQSGRTLEISRLVGRSLRAVVDMKKLGEITVKIDCDVIQADGGTRTASITGGFVAMYLALAAAKKQAAVMDTVAAVSAGIVGGRAVLDLDYAEDSAAGTDANFVMTGGGGMVEIQATAENAVFTDEQFAQMLALAKEGAALLAMAQKEVLGI
ncbi:MAG: ribonuclease PH [Alphaproteobacteria bacterium]|nr:ribonuclease PH [Alphaproteobacteria bacterium]